METQVTPRRSSVPWCVIDTLPAVKITPELAGKKRKVEASAKPTGAGKAKGHAVGAKAKGRRGSRGQESKGGEGKESEGKEGEGKEGEGKEDGGGEDDDESLDPDAEVCCICEEGYEEGCDACALPCKHMFHKACIGKWLRIKNTCPICRDELPEVPSLDELELLSEKELRGKLDEWKLEHAVSEPKKVL